MHIHSAHSLQTFLKNELNELYLSMALRSFSFSLVGIFVSVYLFTKGYPLEQIFWFLCLVHGIHALFAFPSARVALRFGSAIGALSSIPLFLIFYALLYTLDAYHWPLWLLALFAGIGNPLFWLAYHFDFISCSHTESRGQEVGMVKLINVATSGIAPLIGAWIIVIGGFHALLLVTTIIFVISSLPLFLLKSRLYTTPISFSEVFHHQSVKNNIAFLGHGFDQGLSGTIWPLFLFVAIEKSYEFIGMATTISSLFALFAILLIGEASNNHARTTLVAGGIGTSLLWFCRIIWVKTPFIVYLSNALGGIVGSMVVVPFSTLLYNKTQKQHSCNSLITVETLFHVGQVSLYALLALTASFWGAFIIGMLMPIVYFIF